MAKRNVTSSQRAFISTSCRLDVRRVTEVTRAAPISLPVIPMLRVMTYNIKGHGALLKRTHVEQIAATIAEAKPDVAGVQEVHRRTWQSRFHDQPVELERLTGMQLVFGRAFGSERSEYGNAILTRGRIAEWHVEPLPGAGEPRTILAVTIDVGGTQLIAYVTHLSAWG